MAKDVPLGMEFMNWQNLPSLTQTLKGGNSPLLNTIGILMAGGSSPSAEVPGAAPAPTPGYDAEAMGQGVAPPMGGTGQPGMQPRIGGPELSTGNFLKVPQLPGLPQLGQQPEDHTQKINDYWGVK